MDFGCSSLDYGLVSQEHLYDTVVFFLLHGLHCLIAVL